ncbi:MAG: YkgJ family cysteine cluster protein [Cyanobacteria bacterium SIG30]|nr:YkgJ family cysteine cluster protein [Cyanobacteria bacterium SIG30]
MKKFLLEIKKYFYYYVLRKKYFRSGECLKCGRCCEKIYVKHGKNVIEDIETFEKLQKLHKFYDSLEVLGKDENGVIFRCKNLDEEKRICKIHKYRDRICRKYPQEEMFMMGGDMAKTCGYKFTPIFTFEEIMKHIKK